MRFSQDSANVENGDPKPTMRAHRVGKTNLPSVAKDAETRVRTAEAELASIRERLKKPTLPEDRRALANRLNRLQEAIQQLRSNLS